jgi:hypothetical protein
MERIGEEVSRTLGRTGDGSGQVLSELVSAWPAVVGDAVARQAWPLRIGRDGTLHVATSSSTWAFELDRLAPEIVERLGSRLGPAAPRSLRFRPGPLPEEGPALPSPRASGARRESDPDVVAEAAELAAAIEDPELRELVSRAARASLARARSDHQI